VAYDGVTSLSLSPDGKLAVSGSWDHTLKLGDLASGHELRSFWWLSMTAAIGAFSGKNDIVAWKTIPSSRATARGIEGMQAFR